MAVCDWRARGSHWLAAACVFCVSACGSNQGSDGASGGSVNAGSLGGAAALGGFGGMDGHGGATTGGAAVGGAAAGGAGGQSACDSARLGELENQIRSLLAGAADDTSITSVPDFTLLLRSDTGRTFTYSHGDSSASTVYESASTSKLVTAAVILDLVDQGVLSLDTRAEELIEFWKNSAINLRQLLSFTSGLSQAPLCLDLAKANFENCVNAIYLQNQGNGVEPGSEFLYVSTHLQVAGLMAMRASGKASFGEVFDAFKARTGLFASARFDLPSESNPRLAGGMHWSGEEYFQFLIALQEGNLLSDAMRHELFRNQRGDAKVVYSPTLGSDAAPGLGEDWAYALGNWLECPTAHSPNAFDCPEGLRNSSPGAYGAYPFIDFAHGYVGLLARQGSIGTYPEGIALFRVVEELVNEWATLRCGASD